MHRATAIVLSRRELREADYQYTLFTREFGLIRATAQGIRKRAAKLQGHLEPHTRTDIMFVPTQSTYRLTAATMTDAQPSIRKSLAKLAVAEFAGHIIEGHFFESSDEAVWVILTETYEALTKETSERIVLIWFLARLLAALGYRTSDDPKIIDAPRLAEFLVRLESAHMSALARWELSEPAYRKTLTALTSAFYIHTKQNITSSVTRLDDILKNTKHGQAR